MYDIDVLGVQGVNFTHSISAGNNFAIVLIVFILVAFALVWNKNIENLLPVFNYQREIVA